MEAGLGRVHRWGPSAQPPPVLTHVCCGQTMNQDAAWYGGRPRPRLHCVRWGSYTLVRKGAQRPHFSACAYSGQTAGWIKMPLGTVVGLGSGDVVFDEDPVLPHTERGTAVSPTFRPTLLWHGRQFKLLLRNCLKCQPSAIWDFYSAPAVLAVRTRHGLSNKPPTKDLRLPNFLKMGIKYLNLSSFGQFRQ